MPTIDASYTGGRIHAAIARAASATGIDFTYLVQQARVESGLDPDARARTSSATGLYQFIEQSWLGTVKAHGAEHGMAWAADAIGRGADGRYRVGDGAIRSAILDLRRDPQVASAMAAELASDNRDALQDRLGRDAEPVDLYLAHFLGLAGATKFLRASDADGGQSAAALFPAAARSNRAVFYARDGSARSLSEVRQRFAMKFDAEPTTTEPSSTAMAQASVAPPGASARMREWARPDQGPGAIGRSDRATPATARLAYLMLASLGVS